MPRAVICFVLFLLPLAALASDRLASALDLLNVDELPEEHTTAFST